MELYFIDHAVNVTIRRLLASGLFQDQLNTPKYILDLFDAQLDTSLKMNVCVHRLELSCMHQQIEELIATYVSRLREKASKCEFENYELEERLIENIIVSTPYEELRNELLTKPKGHAISQIIERARAYEAIKYSMASFTGIKSHNNNTHTMNYINKSSCGNCGLHHERNNNNNNIQNLYSAV